MARRQVAGAAFTALVLLLVGGEAGLVLHQHGSTAALHSSDADAETALVASYSTCARGFQPVEDALTEVRGEMRNEQAGGEVDADAGDADAGDADAGDADKEFIREAERELPMLQGTDPDDWPHLCVPGKRPESLKDLANLFGARAMSRLAPYGAYQQGAALNAVAQAQRLANTSSAAAAGKAAVYGKGPLIVDDQAYPEVNGEGLVDNMGRVDSYAYDPKARRLFMAVGNGGIYRSDNMAASWTSAEGDLPTTITGAVAWSPFKHTLLALTGEPTFGSSAYTGLGAYWSADLGRHWHHAKGVPAGALGFALAVDPSHPNKVYAATQLGLYVSGNGGRSYVNAKLPTGTGCAGVSDVVRKPQCAFRSVVTDVVVVQPGGVNTTTKAGTVVAMVGWRGGQRKDINGNVQATRNGVYRSPDGRPGSFTKLATTGFARQDAIGRIEVGNAVGPKQDHDLLYAVVQDANLLNYGGAQGIDVPSGATSPVGTTVLNGIYVSRDFGLTWTRLTSGSQLASDVATGSSLTGTGTATGYEPGIQSWYNMWIQPDPTRATGSGAPTRLAFGLEEVWSNDADTSNLPLDGTVPVHFGVVGKYYGGNSCLLLNAGLPACPTTRDPTANDTTTHPDQQDGIWVPDSRVKGGVQLFVGNDGGAYRYQFQSDPDGELDNAHWGDGNQTGLTTLMPYFAAMADDGTVFAGLQDNGNLRIDPKTHHQFETYGGDGFYAAVDPKNSRTAYEEYTNGAISVTTDGGTSWTSIDPGLTASKFSNPFSMDPTNANHILTAGREVVETTIGSSTTASHVGAPAGQDSATADPATEWRTVYDLGTRLHPGDSGATPTATDPANSMSAVATRHNASYVAYCGQCDTLNKLAPNRDVFQNGLATNVGGAKPGKAGTAAGWHMVKPVGLPNRYITAIVIEPGNAKHIVVTLGGYTRRWVPPGAVGDANQNIGVGHLFMSRDGGQHFRNISGNLPDSPASFVAIRGRQLLVGTDVGAFASGKLGLKQGLALHGQPRFAAMKGLPHAPVSSITLKPNNRNIAVLAMFGRDVWTYTFRQKIKADPFPVAVPVAIHHAISTSGFESGAQGWTTSTPPSWVLGTPGHGSGSSTSSSGHSYGITGSGYGDGMDATLTSPVVTLPKGAAAVQWWTEQDTEGTDPVMVEYSTDGRAWHTLATYAGRNPGYPKWSKYIVALPATGGRIQVRFHFTSDQLCSGTLAPPGVCSQTQPYAGVRIDDVTIGTG